MAIVWTLVVKPRPMCALHSHCMLGARGWVFWNGQVRSTKQEPFLLVLELPNFVSFFFLPRPSLPALPEQHQPPLSHSVPAPLLYLPAEEPGAWPAEPKAHQAD